MYDILDHGRMIADDVRTAAYARAIAAVVKPDSVVVDLGTGTGFFALVAARAGARKVYAIESAPVIEVARELVAANGFAEVIELIHADSRATTLPERADILISDIHGALPLFATSLATLLDARRRFLRDGATLIPRRESLHVALAESEPAYALHTDAWSSRHGFDLTAARRLAVNHARKTLITNDELLSDAALWCTLDYATIDSPDCGGRVTLTATRNGVSHGFAVWFDCELADGIGFSNAPSAPTTIYGRVFMPFEEPVPLRAGDALTLDLAARLIGDDYLWRWTTSRNDRPLFRQSTFFGYPQAVGRSTNVASLDVDARMREADDETMWRSLRADVSIIINDVMIEAFDADAAAADVTRSGWFQRDAFIARPLVDTILALVERVRGAGWPAVFAFIYDEPWQLLRTPAIRALARAAIGDDAAQTPFFWTHVVGASGWPPHSDAASPTDPPRLNLWLPLRDATLDNGCMYVVPRDAAPPNVDLNDAASFDRTTTLALLQSARALPAGAGSLLGWDFRTIHWGSRRHDPAAPPRVSIAVELCSAAALRSIGEEPLPLDQLPDFATRLRLIAGAIATYGRREPEVTAWARGTMDGGA